MTQYVNQKVVAMERPVTAWVLTVAFVVLLGLYGYFVNGTIMNIVATKGMQSKIADLTSTVGDLEASYISAKSSLTLAYAESLGFAPSKTPSVYIAQKTSGTLTFNR